MLTAEGFTAVPRWVREPASGVAEYEAAVPDDVLRAVRELAHELRVPVSAVLLAAHAKVLAALSGEQDVVTGYHAGERGDPPPCQLTVVPGSWRCLVSAVGDTEAELLAHRASPVAQLRRELRVAGPSYEVVFAPADTGGGLADDAVLGVGWSDEGGRTGLRLRYRRQALDVGCAARIGGHHLAALRLMAADADAEHATQSLLSADEVGEQLEGLAGPRRTP